MSGPPEIRPAAPEDAAEIAVIYAPHVLSETSFETEPPSGVEMAGRLRDALPRYPWLVCQRRDRVEGYAYAGAHRPRAAYRWSVEVSAYVRADSRRRGVGRALYSALLSTLGIQGYFNAYAGISLPNPASVGFHEAFGFVLVGVYRSVGFKSGAWRDVGWWHKTIRPYEERPAEPEDFETVARTRAFRRALEAAASGLP